LHRQMLNKIILGWIILSVIMALFGRVTVAAPDGGRTAADFLSIGIGAPSAGMGGAYTSMAEGALASYWNPAGLAELEEGGEILFGHFAWYQDINLEHGTAAFKLNDRFALATSITYLGYGQIDGYDEYGYSTGDISAYDWAGSITLGYMVTDYLSLGISGKYINQKLDDISGSTYALDVGLKYYGERFTIGGTIANLGPDMKFESVKEDLPLTGRLGVAIRPINQLLITSIEFEKRTYGAMLVHSGVQMNFMDQYFVRTGYVYNPDRDYQGFVDCLSFGVGFELSSVKIDYAFSHESEYISESLHRFSVILKFGY